MTFDDFYARFTGLDLASFPIPTLLKMAWNDGHAQGQAEANDTIQAALTSDPHRRP